MIGFILMNLNALFKETIDEYRSVFKDKMGFRQKEIQR